jgi:hypothetical protein
MRRSRLSQPAGCPQVHRRDFQNPAACGPCGQPAATDSALTNNTVTLPFWERRRNFGQGGPHLDSVRLVSYTFTT